jgi:hypothetical protein
LNELKETERKARRAHKQLLDELTRTQVLRDIESKTRTQLRLQFRDVLEEVKEKKQRIPGGQYIINYNVLLTFHDTRMDMIKQVTESKIRIPKGGVDKHEFIYDLAEEYIRINYHQSNVEIQGTSDVTIRSKKNLHLLQFPLKAHKHLAHKLLPADGKINTTPDQCVIDYLVEHTAKTNGFKRKWTRKKLIKHLGTSPSAVQIQNWAEEQGNIEVQTTLP